MSDDEITPADPDTEQVLREMKELSELKARCEAKYKELRDSIAPQFEGPRYFMSANGQKLYAFKVQATKIVVDEGRLRELIGDEAMDKLYKVEFDEDAFTREVAAKRIAPAVFKQVTRKLPKGAPHLRFGDPEKPRRED